MYSFKYALMAAAALTAGLIVGSTNLTAQPQIVQIYGNMSTLSMIGDRTHAEMDAHERAITKQLNEQQLYMNPQEAMAPLPPNMQDPDELDDE